jgi:crotonobetainyl-CoA:carnitine CoA-transferase CaiB-like acyl-CoA transferase
LGEDVIKFEPTAADRLRRTPPLRSDGVGHMFAALAQGKRIVRWDPPGLSSELCETLEGADIVIIDRDAAWLGADADTLRARWPQLVVVSVTTLGLTEAASLPEDSLLAEAYGGLLTMIGEPGNKPLTLGGHQTCYMGGIAGFFGAMIALQRLAQGHGGDVVDVALADLAAYVDWKSDIVADRTGMPPSRSGVEGGAWRIVEAQNGGLGVIFQPSQWAAMVSLIADQRLADPALCDAVVRRAKAAAWWPAVRDWAAARTKEEAYHEAQAAGLAFGYLANVADLAESEQYRARSFVGSGERPAIGPLFKSDTLTWHVGQVPDDRDPSLEWRGHRWEPKARSPYPRAPLDGLRVLDLGTITAGAATGRLLADYGGNVIKVESTIRPDPFRKWPEALTGDSGADSPMFDSNNAGKLGIDIDLTNPNERRRLLDLAGQADVVIENFRVGVTAKLGVDAAAIHAANPDSIYLSLSSQGQTGPESGYRSYGSTLDLLSGLASVTGYRGGDGIWSSAEVNYPDQFVSLLGAALVAYCWVRRVTGAVLDIAQREAVTWTIAYLVEAYLDSGAIARPTGNDRPGCLPRDVYPCRGHDRWVAIACTTDDERAALGRLVGVPVQPATASAWRQAMSTIGLMIGEWTSIYDPRVAADRLNAAGVPAAPVLTAVERCQEPHFSARRVFLGGPPRRKGFPFLLRGYSPPNPLPAPALGEHSELVSGGTWPASRNS